MALVGLGAATQPHLRSLQDLTERIDLRYAVTRQPHPDRIRPYTGPVRLISTLDEALADPQVHAVIVATPPSTHLDICQRCFVAGKHVLLEKPLELNLERSQQLAALARQSGLHLGVVLQHRFRPASVALQEVLDTGRLGEIQAASVRVPWWRSQAYYNELGRGTLARDGGGVLLTQAIHTLNLFQALVGVKSVTASVVRQTRLHQMETEDHVSALLVLGNGAPGDLMATTAMYPGFPETIEVIGTLGSARLSGADLQRASAVIDGICAAFVHPIVVQGETVDVSLTFGVAEWPQHAPEVPDAPPLALRSSSGGGSRRLGLLFSAAHSGVAT
jgi:predicted dehydrogenase